MKVTGWFALTSSSMLLCANAFAGDVASDHEALASMREEASRYEHGNGVARNAERAIALYCKAAKLGDAASQFNLGWMYANGRGVPRNDPLAAFFFAAAAAQGVEQAQRMLQVVGGVSDESPECMREPVIAVSPPAEPVPAAFGIQTKAPRALVEMVEKMAPAYQVEPQLALAIMEVESNFDSAATSPRNAMGLMQLIPETAARFNVRNAYDPKESVHGGLAYLRWLLAYFEGDLTLVAAAYNAGERTVERYRGVPPYAETRNYVRRIIETVGATRHPFDAKVTPPSSRLHQMRGQKGAR